MTLFPQTVFKTLIIMGIVAQASFALQIEAPQEIVEAVMMYSKEAGAENRNAILRVSTVKSENCDAFAMKLINSSNGKTIKEVERCITKLPNAALQNGVFEIFGHDVESESEAGGVIKTVLIGAVFTATGILLYCTNTPKPVNKGASQ